MITGHLELQKSVIQLLDIGKLPHALLFVGPKGVGKRTMADAFARRLICGPAQSMLPSELIDCDEDNPLFAQIEAGASSDFHVVTPADGKKNIRVDDVRHVLESLSLSSENKRVVIVDAAEDMNKATANALLKTLEEPGEGIHIILVCHNLSRVLPTIVSRCRQIKFARLSFDETGAILAANGHDLPEAELQGIMRITGGSPGEIMDFMGDGQSIHIKLTDYLAQVPYKSPLKAIELSEALNAKKHVPMALDILQRMVAHKAKEEQSFEWASYHQFIQDRYVNMNIYNLSAQTVMENVLTEASRLVRHA